MITIKLFASLREKLAKSTIEFTVQQPLTVAELWSQAVTTTPPDAFDGALFCAVNHEHVDWQHEVSDGDEVAFFPQITGG